MRIVVGTRNEKKVKVVEKIFKEVLKSTEIETIAFGADSKVAEAPHNEETYIGALNRANHTKAENKADYYVGIESGLVERYGNLFEEAWAVILTNADRKYIGYSSGLLLPGTVVSDMKKGEKHNEIMAKWDKLLKLPDDNRDTWSRYTGGAVSRVLSLEESVRNALIQTSDTKNNLYLKD